MRNWYLWIALAPAAACAADPFVVGACAHFGQGKGLLQANLSMMRQAGIASFRDEIGWGSVERVKGQFQVPASADEFIDQGRKAGLEPLLILDYGNRFYDNGDKPRSPEAVEAFARYAEFIVRHFQGRVRMYEVWNEWDIAIGSKTPGSADDYAALIKAVYPRIKAVDPSITVFGGAPTSGGVKNGWLERILEKGSLAYMDVLSVHTYAYSESGRGRGPEAWGEMMARIETLAQKYSGGKPVSLAVTEMGWPTQIDRRGTPPDLAAAYLARLFLIARSLPFLKGLWWYDFQDDGWSPTDNESNFGLVRPDLTPKPAWFALAAISALVARGEFLGRADASDPDLWVLRFRTPKGGALWTAWSAHPDDGWEITLQAAGPDAAPLLIREAGRAPFDRQWGSRNWTDGRAAAPAADRFDLVVRTMPWLIAGGLDGASVAGVKRREASELSRGLVYLQ